MKKHDMARLRGFTLIELLVVVLIIGILSAIALPQYEKAVTRSRVAEYMVNLKTLAQAATACSLETGQTCTLAQLPIEIPACKPIKRFGNTCSYSITGKNSAKVGGFAEGNNPRVYITYFLSEWSYRAGMASNPEPPYTPFILEETASGGMYCETSYNSAAEQEVCKAFGFTTKMGGMPGYGTYYQM